jgi:hypothetical protein
MQAAEAAGVKGILVQTGMGSEFEGEFSGPIASDLFEAVQMILGSQI